MLGNAKKTHIEIEQAIKEEKKIEKENLLKWHHYLISVLFILVGAVFTAYVQIDIPFICVFFTCVLTAAGIISIITYCLRDVTSGYYRLELVYGVMSGVAALLFYTKQDIVRTYFTIIAGFILIANGVVKLQHSIDMKRIDRKMKKITEMWLVVMIFALVCIAAGFITVYLTPSVERTLFLFVGIALIVAGASDVFTHIVFNRKVKLFRSGGYIVEEKPNEDLKEEPKAELTEDHKTELTEDHKTEPTEDMKAESNEDLKTEPKEDKKKQPKRSRGKKRSSGDYGFLGPDAFPEKPAKEDIPSAADDTVPKEPADAEPEVIKGSYPKEPAQDAVDKTVSEVIFPDMGRMTMSDPAETAEGDAADRFS